MRKEPLLTNHYYHIYNRGVDKRDIFMSKSDLERFTLSALEFNVVEPIGSLKDLVKKQEHSDEYHPDALVSIVSYCFNPNHFHIILKQEVEGGISEFLRRLLGGYTRYFNEVHSRSGSLFQGRFKSKMIRGNAYFLRIRSYVHLNYLIHDIPEEKNNLILSSEKEYDSGNFLLVSKKEAKKVLSFYKDNLHFKRESIAIVSSIREERGLTSLNEEELLP